MDKSKAIEEILKGVDHSRCVGVEITNKTTVTLASPGVFCYSVIVTFSPVPPSIGPQSRETCVFVKRNFSTWGIAGVFTYESDRFSFIAMFSNPLDNNLHKLEYGLEIFEGKKNFREIELKLKYEEMRSCRSRTETYVSKKLGRNSTALVVTLGQFKISGTMSNHSKAVFKILIEEIDSPPAYSPAYNAPQSLFQKPKQ
ncbi:avidin-like [Platysternon megacephalum]|uniref:Avidin-like n=1 Tax=Platysternon megacephalum TaxID=55544 RepID=A0A4D9DRW8_9SAUR|nr:avidin-like [Platysternon megacephalum]